MASGDTVGKFFPQQNEPPAASQATFDSRGANFPHLILDFDASTSEVAVFKDVLAQNYGGNGIDIFAHTAFSSATGGSGVWNFYFERIGNKQADLDDSDGFGSAASMAVDVAPEAGSMTITSIDVPDGAGVSLAAGEGYRLKVERDCNSATDDATGDMELWAIEFRES